MNLICIQESNLNLSSSYRIPDFLLCNRTALTSDLAVFLLMTRTLAAALSFSSGRSYSSLNFPPSCSLSLTLMFATSIRSLERTAPTPFLPPFFPPPKISSFWGTSTVVTPSGTLKILLIPAGRKYTITSFPLTSFLPMNLTR